VTTKLLLVKGMTCPACERQIEDALVEAGRRNVRADSRRGEVVLDPGNVSEGQLREAVDALGYRSAAYFSPASEAIARPQTGSDQWTPLWLLLPAVCCGAPLLLAAATLGFGTWFAANGLLLMAGLGLSAAALFVIVWLRRQGGALR
jgi:copper chaperone CopZ